MSERFEITRPFADGEYKFNLNPSGGGLELMFELEAKTGLGIMALFKRVTAGNYMAGDIREIIRLGLVGGGMAPTEALKLMRTYFDREPIGNHVALAFEVLALPIFGPEGMPAKDAA